MAFEVRAEVPAALRRSGAVVPVPARLSRGLRSPASCAAATTKGSRRDADLIGDGEGDRGEEDGGGVETEEDRACHREARKEQPEQPHPVSSVPSDPMPDDIEDSGAITEFCDRGDRQQEGHDRQRARAPR